MNLKLSSVLLLVGFMASVACADFFWEPNAVDNWTVVNNWNLAAGQNGTTQKALRLPDGSANNTEIRYGGSDVTVNTNLGQFASTATRRLRVYQGATLEIKDGAVMQNYGWIRSGDKAGEDSGQSAGYIVQTGGLVKMRKGPDSGKITIGDASSNTVMAEGKYTISGGTLTYETTDGASGELWLGDRMGKGRFVVQGNGGTVKMKTLFVGGNTGRLGTGTTTGILEFQIDDSGISPVKIDSKVVIDTGMVGGNSQSSSNLVLSLTAAPPEGNIMLVETLSATAVINTFDTVSSQYNADVAGTENARICLTYFDGTAYNNYYYHLTYKGGTGGNDIMLTPEPATLVLLGLGLIALRRNKR